MSFFRSSIAIASLLLILPHVIFAEPPRSIPDPDGQPADMTQKVQVFILLGQSNMLGFGRIDPEEKNGTLSNLVKQQGKYPEFAGNVKTIDARPFWRDKSISPTGAGYHYNHNAETYMEVGNALGWAMSELLNR